MFPFLDLSFIKIPLYGLMIAVGIFIGSLLTKRICKVQEKNFYDFLIVSAVILLFGFIGAKILYVLVTFPIKDYFKILYQMLFNKNGYNISSGFVFYGGLFFGIFGYFVGIKIAGCKRKDFIGIYAFLVPFIQAFGRIGCFCAGCCYGICYEGPFAVYYKNALSDVPVGIGIFPVQLLESFLLFIISLLILYLIYKKIDDFKMLFLYLGYYSVIRFFLEFLRGDLVRKYFLIFSTSQWISIFIFVIDIICMIIYLKKRGLYD